MGFRGSARSWFQTAESLSSASSASASTHLKNVTAAANRCYSSIIGENFGEHSTRLAPTGLPSPSRGDLRATLTLCRGVQHATSSYSADTSAAGFGAAATAAVAPSTASMRPAHAAPPPKPPALFASNSHTAPPLHRNSSVINSMTACLLGRSTGAALTVSRSLSSFRALCGLPTCPARHYSSGSGAGQGSSGAREPTTIRNFAIIGEKRAENLGGSTRQAVILMHSG